MTLRSSVQVANRAPAKAPRDSNGTITLISEFTTVAGQFAQGDIIEMCALPAETIPVRALLVCDQIDSNGTPTGKLDIGIMSGSYLASTNSDGTARTCGTEFASADTTCRAGGVASVQGKTAMQLTPTNVDRSIGIVVNTAMATLVAGAKIRLIVECAPRPLGMFDS
jgi:hypothetical protein